MAMVPAGGGGRCRRHAGIIHGLRPGPGVAQNPRWGAPPPVPYPYPSLFPYPITYPYDSYTHTSAPSPITVRAIGNVDGYGDGAG